MKQDNLTGSDTKLIKNFHSCTKRTEPLPTATKRTKGLSRKALKKVRGVPMPKQLRNHTHGNGAGLAQAV
jgi:hypothetical protein